MASSTDIDDHELPRVHLHFNFGHNPLISGSKKITFVIKMTLKMETLLSYTYTIQGSYTPKKSASVATIDPKKARTP